MIYLNCVIKQISIIIRKLLREEKNFLTNCFTLLYIVVSLTFTAEYSAAICYGFYKKKRVKVKPAKIINRINKLPRFFTEVKKYYVIPLDNIFYFAIPSFLLVNFNELAFSYLTLHGLV